MVSKPEKANKTGEATLKVRQPQRATGPVRDIHGELAQSDALRNLVQARGDPEVSHGALAQPEPASNLPQASGDVASHGLSARPDPFLNLIQDRGPDAPPRRRIPMIPVPVATLRAQAAAAMASMDPFESDWEENGSNSGSDWEEDGWNRGTDKDEDGSNLEPKGETQPGDQVPPETMATENSEAATLVASGTAPTPSIQQPTAAISELPQTLPEPDKTASEKHSEENSLHDDETGSQNSLDEISQPGIGSSDPAAGSTQRPGCHGLEVAAGRNATAAQEGGEGDVRVGATADAGARVSTRGSGGEDASGYVIGDAFPESYPIRVPPSNSDIKAQLCLDFLTKVYDPNTSPSHSD